MQNRWFNQNGTPKRTAKVWLRYASYALEHQAKFEANRIQWFEWDFARLYPEATSQEIRERLCAFVGLYDNERKCSRHIFSQDNYTNGSIYLIGYDDSPPHLLEYARFRRERREKILATGGSLSPND